MHQCIEHKGAISHNGYGLLGAQYPERRAHRLAWLLTYGPIPVGKLVLHACDNRRCVNPDHLFLGTAKDNTQDMLRKGRSKMYQRRKLTNEEILEIRQSKEKQAILSKRYKIDQSVISRIKTNKIWTKIEGGSYA